MQYLIRPKAGGGFQATPFTTGSLIPVGSFLVESAEEIGIAGAVDTYLAAQKARFEKAKALQQAEADFKRQLAEGILVGNIRFAATESDRAKFSQFITLLREAEELQPDEDAKTAFRASSITLVDIHDVVHQVTVTESRQLIVQYGQAVNALWVEFAQRRAALSI